mgnify:CR=1 FL=1
MHHMISMITSNEGNYIISLGNFCRWMARYPVEVAYCTDVEGNLSYFERWVETAGRVVRFDSEGKELELVHDGMKRFASGTPLYIRPMYWGINGDITAIVPSADTTGFALSLGTFQPFPLL